jgi:predicted secreted acid phosphatase
MWKQVQNNIGKFQNLFGNMMIVVDNSDNANYEGGIRSAYRKMAAFAKMEPKMPQAKAWIQGQKKK